MQYRLKVQLSGTVAVVHLILLADSQRITGVPDSFARMMTLWTAY